MQLDVLALIMAGGTVHLSSLPDIDNPNQLFGHKPQGECIQQKGEDTEHHLG